jgi:hypothetical protein
MKNCVETAFIAQEAITDVKMQSGLVCVDRGVFFNFSQPCGSLALLRALLRAVLRAVSGVAGLLIETVPRHSCLAEWPLFFGVLFND